MLVSDNLWDSCAPVGILIRILVLGAATIVAALLAERFLERYLKQAATRLNVSATKYLALRRLIVAAIYVAGVIFIIYSTPQLRSLSVALFASVSIIGIIVGIAAQSTISNVIAGLAIIVSKPFGVGDYVTVRNESGFVEDITFRHTVIRLRDAHMIIPNSAITSDVIFNHSNSTIRCRLDIRVAYNSDLEKTKQIIREEALKVAAIDANTIQVLLSKTDEKGASFSVTFGLEGPPAVCSSSLRESIILRLLREQIEITG
jgi:small-conductance mechanosensitive channel